MLPHDDDSLSQSYMTLSGTLANAGDVTRDSDQPISALDRIPWIRNENELTRNPQRESFLRSKTSRLPVPKHSLLKYPIQTLKTSADITRTVSKGLVLELYAVLNRSADSIAAILLEFFHKPTYFEERRKRLGKSKRQPKDVPSHHVSKRLMATAEALVDLQVPTDELSETQVTRFKAPWIPLFRKTRAQTGLFEDLQVLVLTFIDELYALFLWFLSLFISNGKSINNRSVSRRPSLNTQTSLTPRPVHVKVFKSLFYVYEQIFVKWYGNLTALIYAGVDDREMHDLVISVGYPYEYHIVQTTDGHLLPLDRIPRKSSNRVVLFQHGVFDTAFAWIGSTAGASASNAAFVAYNAEVDVFLANFRGTRERKHIDPNISEYDYWDFSINEHAMLDIGGDIAYILQLKAKENIPNPEITLVAHSLGGAAALIYCVEKIRRKEPHHLVKLLLLSPAGIHRNIPKAGKFTGPFMYHVVGRLFPNLGCRLPARALVFLLAKVMQDLKNIPSTRDLLSWMMVRMVLGGNVEDTAFAQVSSLAFNLLISGSSMKVFRHCWNNYQTGTFSMFDYGERRNLVVYGQPQPPNVLELYKTLEIPVHFLCGQLDYLLPPDDIYVHYAALMEEKPELAHYRCFPNASHVQFTYGQNERLITYIVDELRK